MRTLKLIFLALVSIFYSCNDDSVEKGHTVTITIYEETGFGTIFLNETWQDLLRYSDSDDNKIELLSSTITEGIDIYEDYERGYKFTYKAHKVKMKNPPMDVSDIKYVFIELLSKEKAITENREQEVVLNIAAEKVKYAPDFPPQFDSEGAPVVYDGLLAYKENDTNAIVLPEIDGFEFEEGFEYKIKAKEITESTSYIKQYELIQIISKK